MASLEKLDYPRNKIEIIVVDNGSKDQTLKIAKEHRVKILERPGATISSLRNTGARLAKGEIFAFIDADCLAPPNWLTDALKLLSSERSERIGAVGAEYSLPSDTSWVERVWDLHTMRRRIRGEAKWIPSGNLIVKRACFFEIGGFREDLITSEDVDFCARIRQAGYEIISDPKISVVHLGNPKNIIMFFKKELWRGKGVFQRLLFAFPKVKVTKSILLAIMTLSCQFGIIFGTGQWLAKGNAIPLFTFCSMFFLMPVALSLATSMREKSLKYFFPLALLYLTYGVARSLCILDIKTWRCAKL